MKLYLVRHGESVNNLAGRMTGWMDVDLTTKGVEQAKEVGKFLQKIPFDKVISSDLKRAKDTCEAALPDREYSVEPLIREINVGEIMGMSREERLAKYGEEHFNDCSQSGYDHVGGESREEFFGRAKAFLSKMEQVDAERVVAFCHGGFVQAVLKVVLGYPISTDSILCGNCMIAVFEYINGKWRLYGWNVGMQEQAPDKAGLL